MIGIDLTSTARKEIDLTSTARKEIPFSLPSIYNMGDPFLTLKAEEKPKEKDHKEGGTERPLFNSQGRGKT